MNDQPRKIALDTEADRPCSPPCWILETLHEASKAGLHPNQRAAITRLLGWVEARELDLPQLSYCARTATAPLGLWWSGERHSMRVELQWNGRAWQARLTLFRRDEMVADEWPRHPANLLRGMLARVFPGLFSGRA